MTGRNDPCPCGSGKKYKRCCIGKPVDYGPCDALGRGDGQCTKPSCGGIVCNLCDKRYVHCHDHHDMIQTMLRGHILRVHPEKVPDVVDRLMRDEIQMANIRKQAERNPELWKRLLDYIDERRN